MYIHPLPLVSFKVYTHSLSIRFVDVDGLTCTVRIQSPSTYLHTHILGVVPLHSTQIVLISLLSSSHPFTVRMIIGRPGAQPSIELHPLTLVVQGWDEGRSSRADRNDHGTTIGIHQPNRDSKETQRRSQSLTGARGQRSIDCIDHHPNLTPVLSHSNPITQSSHQA